VSKFKVSGNSEVWHDNNGGTLRNLSLYVDSMSAFGKQYASLDVTSFADSAERVIAGIEESQEYTLSGHYDDTATTGPDAILAPLVGTLGSGTLYPVGTAAGSRKFTWEDLCTGYKITAEVKGRVQYEATFKVDGSVTVGTA
jgi:hypothetical protein